MGLVLWIYGSWSEGLMTGSSGFFSSLARREVHHSFTTSRLAVKAASSSDNTTGPGVSDAFVVGASG